MDEGRLIVSLIWGPAVVLVWGKVLVDGWREWRRYHDRRARAELLTELGLFFVALFSLVAIASFLVAPAGTPVIRLATTMALGAFLAAGIIAATLGRGKR